MEQLQQKLKTIPGGRVLEIGCGMGAFTRVLLTHLQGITEFIATDPDPSVVQSVAGIFPQENLRFQEMAGENVAYSDGAFDTVCISNSLHHVRDVGRVFAEMARVLKTGGTLLVAEIFSNGLTEDQQTTLALYNCGAEIDSLLGRSHNQIFSRETILKHAMSAGLQDSDVFDFEWVDPDFTLEHLAGKYRRLVAELRTRPEYDRYHRKVEDLVRKLSERVLCDVPEVVYLGKKR